MFKRINTCWRVAATGISFFTFGTVGLLLGILVFPLLTLLMRNKERRIVVARDIIRLSFRAFVELMQFLGVLRYEIIGLDRLQRDGLLILANHPTLIDTVFLQAFVKHADCIIKAQLWSNPFTGGPLRAANYINNHQGVEMVADGIMSLQRGNSLIVFPEGTRTPASGDISLKRGAANIAVRGRRSITPVTIRCDPATLGKGEKWWQVPSRRALFRIEVGEDIAIDSFIADGVTEVLAARHLTTYLQHYFTERK
jgi:1-acyl-sn-glycerol-3-phosphate acyltransferase